MPGEHADYTSSTCFHGLHAKCKGKCGWCGAACRCECHAAPKPVGDRDAVLVLREPDVPMPQVFRARR